MCSNVYRYTLLSSLQIPIVFHQDDLRIRWSNIFIFLTGNLFYSKIFFNLIAVVMVRLTRKNDLQECAISFCLVPFNCFANSIKAYLVLAKFVRRGTTTFLENFLSDFDKP